MPVNSLTTAVGLRVGPVLLETLFKHYLKRRKQTLSEENPTTTALRQNELLYDEVFSIIKEFLKTASHHTVEEVQDFANTRTPSPPWVRVVRLMVPMSSCDEAARYLIQALGGEEAARRIVGGVQWWQVRGLNGVDAQWITAKKDWEDAKRRDKMNHASGASKDTSKDANIGEQSQADTGTQEQYTSEMDDMRCILYSHGGGYYFGSVDQERYSIQRFARKINGRVFAINYRLAPQYPFPCAIQDLLAAYLFLIQPPPGTEHRAVDPKNIIVAGDSAGGGLTLALLQVIRDVGLPSPAGGVLISPWVDLTHSFPSIQINTATDVMPTWGLSFQKPSALWPPPPEDLSNRVRAGLKHRIRQALHIAGRTPQTTLLTEAHIPTSTQPYVDFGPSASLPLPSPGIDKKEKIELTAKSGEVLSTDNQIQMYTQNSLLPHPLVSPVTSYLGGLPPLLVIASENEVLRDEIIYLAHKAAHPKSYPVADMAKALYPVLQNIEGKAYPPTEVHLQVYDDTAHVLPILFPFTAPAKFCFRAIAVFCKHVTLRNPSRPNPRRSDTLRVPLDSGANLPSPTDNSAPNQIPGGRRSIRRSISATFSRVGSFRSQQSVPSRRATVLVSGSSRVAGSSIPKLPTRANSSPASAILSSASSVAPADTDTASSAHTPLLTAGHPDAYGDLSGTGWNGEMIRERVSTNGQLRPLEHPLELCAFTLPSEKIGLISELTLRRYLDASVSFSKRFAHTLHVIEKERLRNLNLAKKDIQKNMAALQHFLVRDDRNTTTSAPDSFRLQDGIYASTGGWSWAWAVEEEHPPPSSIVARRDTVEARRLARIADQGLLQGDKALSGNQLWSTILNILTIKAEHTSSDKNDPTSTSSQKPLSSRILERITLRTKVS